MPQLFPSPLMLMMFMVSMMILLSISCYTWEKMWEKKSSPLLCSESQSNFVPAMTSQW
nr:ATP synthase subunit 8 [Laemobothrion sp.]